MNTLQIAIIVGSLRKDSFNRQLANGLKKLAPAGFTFVDADIGHLPLYNQDDDDTPSEAVRALKRKISDSQGLLFLTPEYNRSMPGVLKNALDHASRPYGQSAWAGKPAGVIGASIGTTGTALAQQHLRNVLAYLDVPTMGQPEAFVQVKPELFEASGDIGAASKAFLQTWITHLTDWVTAHQR